MKWILAVLIFSGCNSIEQCTQLCFQKMKDLTNAECKCKIDATSGDFLLEVKSK